MNDVRDISPVWPKRRFVPARVRQVTNFFAEAIPPRNQNMFSDGAI